MTMLHGSLSSTINVNKLTEQVRHEAEDKMAFAQVCEPPDGSNIGKKAGDTVKYRYFPDAVTSSGALTEGVTVPRGTLSAISKTYTLAEYGQAIDFTAKLEDLAELDIEDNVMQALMKDLRKRENEAAYTAFQGTDIKYVFRTGGYGSNNVATNGTAGAAAQEDLDLSNLKDVALYAETQNIPFWDGESYIYVSGLQSIDNLTRDSNVIETLREDSGRSALNGEIGRVGRCRLIKDNHKVARHTSNAYDEGFLIGQDGVQHDVAVPWHVEMEMDDFGRSKAIAYLGIMVWARIYEYATHSREHVIHTTSSS